MNRYPIIDSFGVEIETEEMIPNLLPKKFYGFFREDSDASVQTDTKIIPGENNLFFDEIPEGNNISYKDIRRGVEYVSDVLDFNKKDTEPTLHRFLEYLFSAGESLESKRAGIHVHVSAPYRLQYLKNAVKLTSHLEQVFFYLGGMGYNFRGIYNSSAYCRPITKFGPSIIPGDPNYQIFTLEDLLKAKNLTEFFDFYGGINPDRPPHKYYPVRYNWFTFYPILTKGTVEYRIFNKTLNPNYLISVIKFCQHVTGQFLSPCPLDYLPENSIYDPHTKDSVKETFLRFTAEFPGLERKTIGTLFNIIDRTPEINFPSEYFYTHLSSGKYSVNYSEVSPHYLDRGTKVKNPQIVDIHVLRGER